ncbi:tRNA1(Val) (adenine(37)-N6)-methyltransferase [Algihabitans albus]|uniref:tRNA1(Val) (adenine(37)-N6)-methyltransferase n=1 Tax=Algihabitans albus TaxID=2164067 RepID=UPI000E5CE7DB|nr:methyltransferase [Algihabitans albus]
MTTSDDRLLDGRVSLRQPLAGYRAAIDPVLLAAAVPARPGERVLELGCGAGAAALCLLVRLPNLSVTGLELQPGLAALARHNAEANGRSAEGAAPPAAGLTVLEGDVAAPPRTLGSGYDRVLLNPPFQLSAAEASPLASKDLANREASAPLTLWLELGLRRLRQGGTLTLIHRAERLSFILAALEGAAGDLRVLPLWPQTGKPAKRILVQATRGSRAGTTLLPGLSLHASAGQFTAEAEAVLRGRAQLSLDE